MSSLIDIFIRNNGDNDDTKALISDYQTYSHEGNNDVKVLNEAGRMYE